ncbi:hypothetical protein CHS0354_013809 [Potamilus streckersoni]|uniref:Translin-associated factor X-interacting protein 1 N-terminal domain-containing protein n=1 Tax=Potamilus streckersoni TaxID=2493646 RepID=A0AAE0SHQ2_9BIVA|nr:hypothetical protein CHS0354_013809 [Potamilus streckersoni]
MASRSSTPTSKFVPLPPIITNNTDRQFLQGLSSYIDHEMTKVDTNDDEQRYIIYKTAFNKIIEYVTAYQPILTVIKKEYEDTIEAIKKAQSEASFLHAKLKSMASEPSTIRNYRKRADELEERIVIVKKDNERLQRQLEELRRKRSEKEKQEKQITEPPKRELKKDNRLLPGLTLEESTDLPLLYKKLDKLDKQLKELNISFKTRYVPKSQKIQLKETLDNKVSFRDELLRQGQFYKAKRLRLKVALEAAQSYNRVKPPHQTVGDAVIYSLAKARGMLKIQQEKDQAAAEQNQGGEGPPREGSPPVQATTSSTFEDDDPNKEKEAEMMLEYIEKFNELFEDGKYDEAAIHAASSPKGILRTSATLAKFRDVKKRINGRSPLLSFCDALMSSAGTGSSKPNAHLSAECVECALKENRIDLLSHWITQDRLTLSSEIGHMITNHSHKPNCQALAQNIFMRLHQYRDAVVCYLRQGRVQAGIEFARNKAPFRHDDYIHVLRVCPSLQLLHVLVEGQPRGSSRPLPVGVVIQTLLQEDNFELALQFIQELQNTSSIDDANISAFQAAVLDDTKTTEEEWNGLVSLLQDQDYEDTALSLLASVTVLTAMKKALHTSKDFEELEQTEEHSQGS